LNFARKEKATLMLVDLNAIVDDLDMILRRLLGPNIELAVHLDPAAGRVRLSAGQVEQVLLNLVLNARDAMSAGASSPLKRLLYSRTGVPGCASMPDPVTHGQPSRRRPAGSRGDAEPIASSR